MSQGDDVYDLPQEDRKPFDENGDYDSLYDPWDEGYYWTAEDDWEEERREIEKEIERLENEGGIGNQEA